MTQSCLPRRSQRTAEMGGYLPLAPGVSTVRCPIPQRTFKYVATVQSVTDDTCQKRSFAVSLRFYLKGLTNDWVSRSYTWSSHVKLAITPLTTLIVIT
jgi:hypothetical protein